MKMFIKSLGVVLLTLYSASVYAQGQGEEKILDSLLQELPKQKEDTNKVKLLDAIGHNFGDLYPDESIKYEKQELELAEKLNFTWYIARAHMHLGNDYLTKLEYGKSWLHMAQSVKRFKELHDNSLLKIAYINIGTLFKTQEQYDSALCYFDSSLLVHDFVKGELRNLLAYYEMCGIYDAMGADDSVLAFGYRAIDITNNLNDERHATHTPEFYKRYIAGIYGFMGEAYLSKAGRASSVARKAVLDSATVYLEQAVTQNKYALAKWGYHDDVNTFALVVLFSRKLSIAYVMAGRDANAIASINSSGISVDSFTKELNMQAKGIRDVVNQVNESKILAEQKELKTEKRNKVLLSSSIVLLIALLVFIFRNFNSQVKANKLISAEKKRSEDLLLNILPEEVAEELKANGSAEAKLIDEVTVLFTDFKGFTQLAERLSPKALVAEINECFSAFDTIMQQHGVEKIKTIGDSYMAAGGLPTANKTHPVDVVNAAIAIQQFMQAHKLRKAAAGELFFEIRIGVHTGPVVAGIVGIKKFQYDIWGDTVNTASRMESSGSVGKVNISETTYDRVKDTFDCVYRGEIEAKGKGMLKMYYV